MTSDVARDSNWHEKSLNFRLYLTEVSEDTVGEAQHSVIVKLKVPAAPSFAVTDIALCEFDRFDCCSCVSM
jgi:hypothetical protein